MATLDFAIPQAAYADATTCRSLTNFQECATVGKDPSECYTFDFGTSCFEDSDNRRTAGRSNAIRDECHAGSGTCTVEGGPP
jgi:hypothetical protein